MAKQRFQVTINDQLVARAFVHMETEGFNSLSEYLEHLIRQASAQEPHPIHDAPPTAAGIVQSAVAGVQAATAARKPQPPTAPVKYKVPRKTK